MVIFPPRGSEDGADAVTVGRGPLRRLLAAFSGGPTGDDGWVGETLRRTAGDVTVFVFRGEVRPPYDLVVTHRGPGRERLLGGGSDDVDWCNAVHPEDRLRHRAAESFAQLSKGRPIEVEFRLIGTDGVTRWMHEHLVPRMEAGRLLVDGIVVEVSAQRLARTQAEQAQRRLEAVMRSASTYVWVAEVQPDGSMHDVYSVSGIEQVLGGAIPDDVDKQAAWRGAVHPEDLERFDAALAAAGTGQAFDMEYRLIGYDGVTRIVRDQAVVTLLGRGRYRLDGLVRETTREHEARRALGAALEIAEDRAHQLAEAHAELERLATIDALTGLANRRHATAVMTSALERGPGLGIAMLDVDRFKLVNDTFGHVAGDAVLVEVSRRLASVRAEDLVARWGGEEFCVLLTDITDDAALLAAAERLRAALADVPVQLGDGRQLQVTASVGVARAGVANPSLDRLVAAADDALYVAKHGGRNQVSLGVVRPVSVIRAS